MTQEEKQLLLVDLCARLHYGLIVKATYKDGEGWKTEDRKFKGLYDDGQVYIDCVYTNIENVKPYLRPMSSMTEDEREELSDYLCERVMSDKSGITFPPDPIHGKGIPFEWMSSCIDWLNAHHFDYRCLIEKGLALEAPEGMYK